MRKPSRNEQILLVVLAGVAGSWWFTKKVHAPLEKEIAALETEFTDLGAKRAELEARPVETASLKKRIATAQTVYDAARTEYDSVAARVLAPRDRIQETLLEIQSLASENGLEVREARLDSSGTDSSKVPAKGKGKKPQAKSDTAAADSLRGRSMVQRRWAESLGLATCKVRIEGDYLDFVAFAGALLDRERLSLLGNLRIRNLDEQGKVSVQGDLSF